MLNITLDFSTLCDRTTKPRMHNDTCLVCRDRMQGFFWLLTDMDRKVCKFDTFDQRRPGCASGTTYDTWYQVPGIHTWYQVPVLPVRGASDPPSHIACPTCPHFLGDIATCCHDVVQVVAFLSIGSLSFSFFLYIPSMHSLCQIHLLAHILVRPQ